MAESAGSGFLASQVLEPRRDPLEAVRENKLREDLYYRVNVFSIELPPLRKRPEDIPRLVEHFIAKHGQLTKPTRLGGAALERLQNCAWPGNVRELENMIERALIISGGGVLTEQHFSLGRTAAAPTAAASVLAGGPRAATSLTQAVEELEGRMIDDALARTEGNKAKAAALLDISERTLWYKLKKHRPEQEADS